MPALSCRIKTSVFLIDVKVGQARGEGFRGGGLTRNLRALACDSWEFAVIINWGSHATPVNQFRLYF